MAIVFDGYYGWDGFLDYLLIDYVNELETMEEKLAKIKSLYINHNREYNRWKHVCLEEGELSDIFGTKDHPIEFDESKL